MIHWRATSINMKTDLVTENSFLRMFFHDYSTKRTFLINYQYLCTC